MHQKSVHMGQKFQCPECEYQANQKSNLVIHHKSVHMGQKYQCPECEYQASCMKSVTKHKQRAHELNATTAM